DFIDSEIWNREDSRLSVVNTDQLLLKLQSGNNIISDGFAKDLIEAVDLLESEDFSSMVLYADGRNFSVGANLYMMKKAHELKQVEELVGPDRKSTRLNSSHVSISYAVFCLKKKINI